MSVLLSKADKNVCEIELATPPMKNDRETDVSRSFAFSSPVRSFGHIGPDSHAAMTYFTSSSSTTKCSFAFGGITGGAPRSP